MSGTIQPARFLSHSGKILPGVRRPLLVTTPAAGADWKVTVPAGVMWRILSGVCTLTTSAVANNREPGGTLTVNGVTVYAYSGAHGIGANAVYPMPIVTDAVVSTMQASDGRTGITFPFVFIPDGTTITAGTLNIDVADQWSAVALWVEEVYVTDAQLSTNEIAREMFEREEAAFVEQQLAQTGGGN